MGNYYCGPILVLLMLASIWYGGVYSNWLATIFGVLLLILMFKYHCCIDTVCKLKPIRRARRRPVRRRHK